MLFSTLSFFPLHGKTVQERDSRTSSIKMLQFSYRKLSGDSYLLEILTSLRSLPLGYSDHFLCHGKEIHLTVLELEVSVTVAVIWYELQEWVSVRERSGGSVTGRLDTPVTKSRRSRLSRRSRPRPFWSRKDVYFWCWIEEIYGSFSVLRAAGSSMMEWRDYIQGVVQCIGWVRVYWYWCFTSIELHNVANPLSYQIISLSLNTHAHTYIYIYSFKEG